tara:strand:+ start:992 stop:1774 length:783 start_codon:yes stop_codon:yes gene_type:complete
MRLDIPPNKPWLRDLAGAWVFYTVFPGIPLIKPRFERIARFAPLIGIVIGLIESCLWIALTQNRWNTEAIALLTMAIGIWITGGLHFDGVMDTFDGIGAGKNRSKEAMKDSRVGASGVQAMSLIIFIQLASLIKLDSLAPIAIPIATFWSRCSPLWAIDRFSYLHQDVSTSFHNLHWKKWKEIKPSLLIISISISILAIIEITIIDKISLSIGILIGIIPALMVPNWLGKKLGGHSGDTYGACVVLVETFMLLFLAIAWS